MDVKYVPTTCPYCGTGCGFNLVVSDKKVVGVAPWHRNPVNDGKLCPKGNYAAEFINSPDRLTKPLIKKDGKFVEASWDEAYKLIASKFKGYKGEEMACLASARVSNEENYLMQKFARAVLKTPNIDHCARLCHASTVVGLAGAFGSGAMTQSIADIAESKCILIIGSNTFETHPLIGRRVMQAKAKGAKVIYADPRFTPTGKQADLYLPFYSGTDVAIFNCFMQQILKNGWENKEFVAKRTKDFEKVKEIVMKDAYSVENVSKISGIPAKDLITAAEWFGKSGQSAILYSMGITQHTTGVDNVKSIANLQMLTGNLGRPGTGICALRGQNNVQGACDMGALANVYSGYQAVIVPEMRKKMMDAWGCEIAEGKVGLTVTKLINTLADTPGVVKCVYIMGENPMISDPDLHHVEKGMKNVEFMVVQDIFMTETAKFATCCFTRRLLCREGRHPDQHRAPCPEVEKSPGPARRGKGRLADLLRACQTHGIRETVPVQECRRGIYRDLQGHPVLWRYDLCTARETRSPALAVPDSRAPGNPDPAQGEVHPPGRTGYLHADRVQIPGRSSGQGLPADPDHRALYLAVAYRHDDPSLRESRTRRTHRLGRDQPRGCKSPQHQGQGNGQGHHPQRGDQDRCTGHPQHQERCSLHPVPLRGMRSQHADQQRT